MRKPACAASGCDVATALRASIGMRCEGYGNSQSKGFIAVPSQLPTSPADARSTSLAVREPCSATACTPLLLESFERMVF
jgi:hypothetical protein